LVDCDELSKSADSPISWTRKDSVSHLESSDLSSNFDDFACAIMAQNERELIRPQHAEFAIAQLEIDWVHTRGVNSHQDVRGARLGFRKISNLENLIRSVSSNEGGYHMTSLFGSGSACPATLRAVYAFWEV
jgi:hypothetical protein